MKVEIKIRFLNKFEIVIRGNNSKFQTQTNNKMARTK